MIAVVAVNVVTREAASVTEPHDDVTWPGVVVVMATAPPAPARWDSAATVWSAAGTETVTTAPTKPPTGTLTTASSLKDCAGTTVDRVDASESLAAVG